jgi:hypothetical protein
MESINNSTPVYLVTPVKKRKLPISSSAVGNHVRWNVFVKRSSIENMSVLHFNPYCSHMICEYIGDRFAITTIIIC